MEHKKFCLKKGRMGRMGTSVTIIYWYELIYKEKGKKTKVPFFLEKRTKKGRIMKKRTHLFI